MHLSLYAVLEQGKGALCPKWESDSTSVLSKVSFLSAGKARKCLLNGKGTVTKEKLQIKVCRAGWSRWCYLVVGKWMGSWVSRVSPRITLQRGKGVKLKHRRC